MGPIDPRGGGGATRGRTDVKAPPDAGALMGRPEDVVDELDARRAFANVAAGLLGRTTMGVKVGRFVLLDRVGVGAMGVVYSAYDPQLDRKIAIKLLHAGDTETEGPSPLLSEARALARLSHPNVVTVHEVGTADGRLFLAMELLHGQPLSAWSSTPRPWPETLRVMIQAARGLAAAHEVGLVHRDFKPSNAVIDDAGRVTVLDFGLADAAAPSITPPDASSSPAEGASRSPTGTAAGTPAYMSPEQHRGRSATPASDQFSWSVAAYECLYGQLPFATKSRAQLLDDIALARLAPTKTQGHVPAWVRRALLRGLRADPGQRWPSMNALVAELDRGLERRWRRLVWPGIAAVAAVGLFARSSAPSVPQPPCDDVAKSTLSPTWNAASVERVLAALRALDGAATTPDRLVARLEAYAASWVSRRTEVCTAARAHPEQQVVLAQAAECLDGQLEQLAAAVDLLSTADVSVLREADRLVPDDAELAACDPEAVPQAAATADRAEIQRSLSRATVLGLAGDHAAAAALAEDAFARAEASGDIGLRARARRVLGVVHGTAGAHAEAIAALQAALVDAERAGDDVARLDALRSLASELLATSRLDEAARLLAQAQAAHDRFRARPWSWDAHLLELRARLALAREDVATARQLADEHLELVRDRAASDVDRVLRARVLRAEVASKGSDIDDAFVRWAAIATTATGLYGEVHPIVASAHSAIGVLHYRQGELAQAEAELEASLKVRERLAGADHPSLVAGLVNLGGIVAQRDPARAEPVLERAIAIARTDGLTSERYLASALHNLAGVLKLLERFDDAGQREREAWEIHREYLGESHPRTLASSCDLGEALLRQDRIDEAFEAFEQARRLEVAERGKDSVALIPMLTGLAKALEYRDRVDEARVYAEEALRLAERHDVPPPRLVSVQHALLVVLLATGTSEALARAEVVLAAAETAADDPRVSNTTRDFLGYRRSELEAARVE